MPAEERGGVRRKPHTSGDQQQAQQLMRVNEAIMSAEQVQQEYAQQQEAGENRRMNPECAAVFGMALCFVHVCLPSAADSSSGGITDTRPAWSLVLRFQSEVVDADAKLAHLLLKVLPVHPGPLGGARDIAARGPECVDEEIALPLPDEFFLGLAELDLAAVSRRFGRHARDRHPRRVVVAGGIGAPAR